MSQPIRFADETDAEYAKRTRVLFSGLSGALWGRQLAKVYEHNKAFDNLLKVAELRRSCGVKDDSTFKWDVYQ